VDDETDYALDWWAGVLSLKFTALAPAADPRLQSGVGLPDDLSNRSRGRQLGG
jgi:hypothetical protein